MITIRKEWKEKAVVWQGITYDFRHLSQEKIERIWKNNPNMAHFFEETEKEKEFFAQKPEHVTEEEFFEEAIKKAKRAPRKK